MSNLAPLLEVQELDQAADAERARSETLPERASLLVVREKLRQIEAERANIEAEKARLVEEEQALGADVSAVAKQIEQADVERYSGKRIDRDQAAEHDAAQQSRRAAQAELEDRELAILEALEGVDAKLAESAKSQTAMQDDEAVCLEAIRRVETDVGAELARLATCRETLTPQVPDAILTAYERVRAQPRMNGRGVALLNKGSCGGCRIKLPSLEVTQMLAEPDDALIQCPQCRRVLAR